MSRKTWSLIVALAFAAGARATAAEAAGAVEPPLATVMLTRADGAARAAYDGVVEALRQTTMAAQVSGAVIVDRRKAAMLGVPQQAIVSTLRAGLAGEATAYLHDQSKYPVAATLQLPGEAQGDLDALLSLAMRSAVGKLVPIRELVTVSDTVREQPIHHKDLLPVNHVIGDMAGGTDSPLYAMFQMRSRVAQITPPGGGTLAEHFIDQPTDPYRGYAVKWDGEWQITYETFRDRGAAYAVGLVLI